MGMGRFGLCIDLQTPCDRLCIIALSLGSYHTLLVHSCDLYIAVNVDDVKGIHPYVSYVLIEVCTLILLVLLRNHMKTVSVQLTKP
jgi:hypothetical protein